MTDRQLEERLRRWYETSVDTAPLPSTLPRVLDELPERGRAWRLVRLPRPVVVLLAALLLAGATAGAVLVGSQVFKPDPSLSLDPANLDPCHVLPGPGLGLTTEPLLHDAPAIVGGNACAYGYDDGRNVHLQLRDERTDADAAAALAGELFGTASGGDRPTSVLIGGHQAWLGVATWPPADGSNPAHRTECAAIAVHANPYFFVVWRTCQRNAPPLEHTQWQVYRENLEVIAAAVVTNLEALNEGRAAVHTLVSRPRWSIE
jgi:hypothetical protein